MSLSQAMPFEESQAQTLEEQLELAVQQHARLVYRIAYSALRNHHDAEDATQETFLRVLRYGKKLNEVREMRSWLARIAWRVSIERKRKPGEISLEDVTAVAGQLRSIAAGAEEIIFKQEMSGVLEKLIATLPKKLRQPIVLSTVEEFSMADIAAVLEVSEAAVRSNLFRARKLLRERLLKLLEGHHDKQ